MTLSKYLEFFRLSSAEFEILAELTSRQFGHVRLEDEAHFRKKKAALKTVALLEQALSGFGVEEWRMKKARKRKVPAGEEEGTSASNDLDEQPPQMDPKAFRKLGHLHLLLENYSRAMSAYQKYGELAGERAKTDVDYLYGKGLVFFHFHAFHPACETLQEVLYLTPDFERAGDVHVRLALMRKAMKSFRRSLIHFRIALRCGQALFSEAEILFHIAHLHEVQGKLRKAAEMYRELLQRTDLSSTLTSEVHRQLAWILYSGEPSGATGTHGTPEERSTRVHTAIQHLQKSLELEPRSGQCLYLLGRCYASIGKVHEAFIAYRNSVDKSESNADTWCSIGVLYQQQNQPMDALQAYICAVQLEKLHGPAWTNLGMLYESAMQFQDALTCYCNAALKCGYANPMVHQRVKYLKSQLNGAMLPPQPPANFKIKSLPSVEEAWNLPVSNEMAGRHANKGGGSNKQVDSAGTGAAAAAQMGKRAGGAIKTEADSRPPPIPLTPQQLQTLGYLQSQTNLAPPQQQLLHQLQQQFQMHKLWQARHVNKDAEVATGASANSNQPVQPDLHMGEKDLGGMVSDKELEALISQQDIGSFAENLLKEIQETDGKASSTTNSNDATSNGVIKEENDDDDNIMDTDADEDKDEKPDGQLSSLDIPTKLESVWDVSELEINVEMKGEEIVEHCKQWSKSNPTNYFPIRRDRLPTLPSPPDGGTSGSTKATCKCKEMKEKENKEKWIPSPSGSSSSTSTPSKIVPCMCLERLLPPTPSVPLDNKKDAFSPQLQNFCLDHPIAIIRGIAAALKLDLGLFSTKGVSEVNPDQTIQILTQLKQKSDENLDSTFTRQVWLLETKRTKSTISDYATYQTATFHEGLREEKAYGPKSDLEESREAMKRNKKSQMYIQVGICPDLSDAKLWRGQLTELMKLPSWARVVSAGNILSHIGYPLTEANTVSLHMMVPFAKLGARQDSVNFSSININIGPGDCEWFAVPHDYWAPLMNLCKKHGVDFINDSWWPKMDDLKEEEIPVYRFLQHPGDMVWVNAGCIYWIKSNGWCNSIQWNVGPLSLYQYHMAVQKWRWNRLQFAKSIVPMVHLSWNLARNIRMNDESLYDEVKKFIFDSLRDYVLMREYLLAHGIQINSQPKKKNDPVHFCGVCSDEIFGLLFLEEDEAGKQTLSCCFCAQLRKGGFSDLVCIEEQSVEELVRVYDNFRLQVQNTSSVNYPANMFAAAAFNPAMLSYS